MEAANNVYADNLVSIQAGRNNGYYSVAVEGEMAGNAADNLIDLFDHAMLMDQSTQFLLNLCKVTYISGYSFGVIARLWKKAKGDGRNFFIVANAALNEKFNRLGLHDKIDLKVISFKGAPEPAFS